MSHVVYKKPVVNPLCVKRKLINVPKWRNFIDGDQIRVVVPPNDFFEHVSHEDGPGVCWEASGRVCHRVDGERMS